MSSYLSTVTSDFPVAIWPLNETSGSVAGRYLYQPGSEPGDGSYVGSPTLGATGLIGTNYAVTTTTSSYVSLPRAGVSPSFAFELWFSCSSSPHPLWRDSSSAASGWLFDISGTNPVVRTAGSSHTLTSVASSSLRDGARHQFVLVVYANAVQVFLDGVLADSWSASVTSAAIAWPILLGKNGTATDYAPATFAAPAFYNGLSDTRIAAHYAARDSHVVGTATVASTSRPVPAGQTIPVKVATVTSSTLTAVPLFETLRVVGPATVVASALPVAALQKFTPRGPLQLVSSTVADIEGPLAAPDPRIKGIHVVSPSVPMPTLVKGMPV